MLNFSRLINAAIILLLIYFSWQIYTTRKINHYYVNTKSTDNSTSNRKYNPFIRKGCLLSAGASDCQPKAEDINLDWGKIPQIKSILDAYRYSGEQITFATNIRGDKFPIRQGNSIWLTVNQGIQNQLDQWINCYTNSSAMLGSKCPNILKDQASKFYENSRARMLSMLAVDVKSGGIIAMGSKFTPCYKKEIVGCPDIPFTSNSQSRLDEQVFVDKMPGSLVKIPLTLGLLKAGLSTIESEQLKKYLIHSDSEGMIDIMMCLEQKFSQACRGKRWQAIVQAASELGWYTGMNGQSKKFDILAHNKWQQNYQINHAKWLINSDDKPLNVQIDDEIIKFCYKDGSKTRWRNCNFRLSPVIAALYGQGESQVSPVAMSRVLLHLHHAARGNKIWPEVHLLSSWHDNGKPMSIKNDNKVLLNQAHSLWIEQALVQAVLKGSSSPAQLSAEKILPKTNENTILLGKTGTPLFPSADNTLQEWREECTPLISSKQQCYLSPLKWFAGLVYAPNNPVHGMVVVSLAERNYQIDSEKVDDPKDAGVNVAAESAMLFAKVATRTWK